MLSREKSLFAVTLCVMLLVACGSDSSSGERGGGGENANIEVLPDPDSEVPVQDEIDNTAPPVVESPPPNPEPDLIPEQSFEELLASRDSSDPAVVQLNLGDGVTVRRVEAFSTSGLVFRETLFSSGIGQAVPGERVDLMFPPDICDDDYQLDLLSGSPASLQGLISIDVRCGITYGCNVSIVDSFYDSQCVALKLFSESDFIEFEALSGDFDASSAKVLTSTGSFESGLPLTIRMENQINCPFDGSFALGGCSDIGEFVMKGGVFKNVQSGEVFNLVFGEAALMGEAITSFNAEVLNVPESMCGVPLKILRLSDSLDVTHSVVSDTFTIGCSDGANCLIRDGAGPEFNLTARCSQGEAMGQP